MRSPAGPDLPRRPVLGSSRFGHVMACGTVARLPSRTRRQISVQYPFRRGMTSFLAMRTTVRVLGAAALLLSVAAQHAHAHELLVRGPPDYRDAPKKFRYTAPRQSLDLGAAITALLAGAALQLVPRVAEALTAKLASEAFVAPATTPVVTAQGYDSPPSGDVMDDIEGNSRGITRDEVEAALTDWCASHADAPLCVKLRVTPPPDVPRYQPAPNSYYLGFSEPRGRGYYRPGRFRTWNGCQPGWTVQDGLCKPYRGF
jgi:hypothetical protein